MRAKRALRTQSNSVLYGRVMRAIRGERTVAEFAKKLGVSAATVLRAEEGWIPNFTCKGNIAEKAGISGYRWDWADVKEKHQGQIRIGL